MKRHEYSNILEAIAKGMEVQILTTSTGIWESIGANDALARILEGFESCNLRVKPKTIRIAEYDVPEPMREAPIIGTVCYQIELNEPGHWRLTWNDSEKHQLYLKDGLIFKTAEDVKIARAAILSLFKKEAK